MSANIWDQVAPIYQKKQEELDRERHLKEYTEKAKKSDLEHKTRAIKDILEQVSGKNDFQFKDRKLFYKDQVIAWSFQVWWDEWEDPNVDYKLMIDGYVIHWYYKRPSSNHAEEHKDTTVDIFQKNLAELLAEWMIE
jgi:transposase